jgi:RNA polymerase sigma-70 factor (ECF subfamily)
MTVDAAETHRPTLRLVAAARVGDEDAFRKLVEPHRHAIHIHCYRMLGSLHEAEDIVQETFLRAWRRLETYAARASFGAWLYGIATHACLDVLARREPRRLPSAVGPPGDPTALPAPPLVEVPWLEPYPELDPALRAEERETIRLAFVAAIQRLPPRQRAALLLRDGLGWSSREVADLLGSSVASVNSALQRARSAVENVPESPPRPTELALASRYLAAWEAADIPALAELLREDAELAMPPTPTWYRGRDDVAAFLDATFARIPAVRLAPTRANGQPAFVVYDGAEPIAIKVLTCDRRLIRALTGFTDASLFRAFDL